MDEAELLSRTKFTLKPNLYLKDPEIPYNYQKKGSLLMLKRPRMILGDDVGLGKTLESIVAFTYIKAAYPQAKAFILTESITLKQWQEEIEWLTHGLTSTIVTAQSHPKPAQRVKAFRQHDRDILITTYSQIYKYWPYIREGMGPFWILFADEPNYFKNPQSQLHMAMFDMINTKGGPKRAYGMTATIIENHLKEAFGIMRIVTPGVLPSMAQFEKDFCVMKPATRRRPAIVKRYINLDKFRKTIDPVFFGRLQDDPEVEQELPEVITKDVPIEMSREQSLKVLEAVDRIVGMADGSVKQIEMLPSLIINQQFANDPRLLGFDIRGAKTKALMEMLEGSLDGKRVLIYSKLRSMIDIIETEIRRNQGMSYGRITGAENPEERERVKKSFMSDDPHSVKILLGTRAVAKGANLQKGGHLIFFDLPWSYGIYRQIVGRLKRTGSSFSHVAVYRFLSVLHPSVVGFNNSNITIDHYTRDVVMKKFGLWKAITDDQKSIETSSSDIAEIFNAVEKGHK